MKRKRKRAVRVYQHKGGTCWVYGRGDPELWTRGGHYDGTAASSEKTCIDCGDIRLTGPALAAWLLSHPKPKGK
jgi:hypothetical protein